jgi:hypothetical protein
MAPPLDYVVKVGDNVSYLAAGPPVRWRSAKVTAVTDQNNVVLALILSNRTRAALNGGVAVAKRTTGTETNVWRPI